MNDSYKMFACIDFETDSYAITVPILKSARSNYVFVPKTDNNFIITDFYVVEELGYPLHYLEAADVRTISLGQKTPVPLLEDGTVFILDVEWTSSEIRIHCPQIGEEALKAFVSLRSRMSAKNAEVYSSQIGLEIDDLLSNPVRSSYWVSKFAALVRSAFESAQLTPELLRRLEDGRRKWIKKYAAKSPLKTVKRLLDTSIIAISEGESRAILLKRFEGILLTKGINTPAYEINEHIKMFPQGFLFARREVHGDFYTYRRMPTNIRRVILDQLYYEIRNYNDPNILSDRKTLEVSHAQLKKYLTFLEVVAGDEVFEREISQYFLPLLGLHLDNLRDLSSRANWLGVVNGGVVPDYFRNKLSILFSFYAESRPSYEEIFNLFHQVEMYHKKTAVLQKIVSPYLRAIPDDALGFDYIDYTLLEELRISRRNRDMSSIKNFLRATHLS